MSDNNNDERDEEEALPPHASFALDEVLRPVSVEQVRAYLEKTGWELFANHFVWGDGWSLRDDVTRPMYWVYVKPDPGNPKGQHFVAQVPGRPEHRSYLDDLQRAIERIAQVEETTFVTVLCTILGVEQLVLHPERKEETHG